MMDISSRWEYIPQTYFTPVDPQIRFVLPVITGVVRKSSNQMVTDTAVLRSWTWWLVACLVLAGCQAKKETKRSTCPAAGEIPTTERCLRAELGIPDEAKRVLILSQSAHLDWDWTLDFGGYFETYVDEILLSAFSLLDVHHDKERHYYYSVAETAFLQAAFDAHPELKKKVRAVGHDLRIVGGGITSPDSLLPQGESFIRDYLVGKTWIDKHLGLPMRQAWLPDNFGQDTNLPIVLEAMGMQGVAFARVPGVDEIATFLGIRPPTPGSTGEKLLASAIDFIWVAADGSEVLAHWMPESYCQGDKIDLKLPFVFPGQTIPDATDAKSTNARIQEFLDINGPASPTPYVFVPIGCDFQWPKADLLDYVAAWNQNEYNATGVWAVAATFDHYVQLVSFHRDKLERRSFDPTPYWTGFYASRPSIKRLHVAGTQAMLAAEVFGVIADGIDKSDWEAKVAARTARILEGWTRLVPSNHHDYITGTGVDEVYASEQLPGLEKALAIGVQERDAAIDAIAGAIDLSPGEGVPVLVLNSLGFPREGLVVLPKTTSAQSVAGSGPVQTSAEGGTIFWVSAPSLGYKTVRLVEEAVTPTEVATISGSDTIVLQNSALTATVSRNAAWGLTSVVDRATGAELIAAGEVANALVVYRDQGGIYRFGHEIDGCAFEAETLAPEVLTAEVLETGPLRVRVETSIRLDGKLFVREYILVAGEPYLRMISRGAAPDETSVFVHFPLNGSIDTMWHGTPYHWAIKTTQRRWPDLTFEATHDFVNLGQGELPLAAIYHAGVPAWAATSDGMVVGALWRNSPVSCSFYGADGSDPDTHEVVYALRVPTGIEAPTTGRPHREAVSFQTALQAAVVSDQGNLPEQYSLASVAPPAIITAAKPHTTNPKAMVLRFYQPTNEPSTLTVSTNIAQRFGTDAPLRLRAVNALEDGIAQDNPILPIIEGDAASFTLQVRRALTSVAIELAR